MGQLEKLQKIIAASGRCSRRAAEVLIEEGRVAVNGVTASLGDRADIETDTVTVDGENIAAPKGHTYVLLNKPKGYVSTSRDEKGRKNVTQLVDIDGVRLYSVGRLDMYSEGLLILTDDGDFTYKLTHPRHELYKEYIVRVSGKENSDPEKFLSKSMEIDGYKIQPAKVKTLEKDGGVFTLSIKIKEGRNRQIRKMCALSGYRVLSLERVAIGFLKDPSLKRGKWRYLSKEEVEGLVDLCGVGEK